MTSKKAMHLIHIGVCDNSEAIICRAEGLQYSWEVLEVCLGAGKFRFGATLGEEQQVERKERYSKRRQ